MKPSTYHRIRRRNAGRENGASKTDSRHALFFGEPAVGGFFQPQAAIQRKCEKCEEEDKKVKQMPEKKEEEKPIQRMEADDKKEEEKPVQTKSNTDAVSTATQPSGRQINSIDNGGTTMSASLQAFFGHRMHYNFADVKIHTGHQSDQSAKAINAQAYTYGNHIVFANGKYDPNSDEGKKLLAHELVHVMQQQNGTINRQKDPEQLPEVIKSIPTFSSREEQFQNTRHFANCEGVTVEGHTDANYGNSYSAPGSSTPGGECEGCSGDDCVTNTGTVVSTFTTNPVVSLPSVPSGLNGCEQQAVRNFINTTLRAHEQQHVAAFNQYRGTVRTPYTYRGCADGLDAYTQDIHDRIESSRKAAADAASAALDAGGANIFSITCECPDPEPSE